jgi:lipopolysaccharide transport system ATP-binding protein
MLELGAGFDPDFTGRENVTLAATVYGLAKAQIAARFDAIVAYSGIGDFIDRPVREYSSGMYARLAFALSIHVDADILVIDEILSVGDAAFQRRCLHSLKDFQAAGGTLLFVSHDPASVRAQCDRAIWLDRGEVRADGPSDTVCSLYLEAIHGQAAEFGGAQPGEPRPREAAADTSGEPWKLLLAGEPVLDPRWAGANTIRVRAAGSDRIDHGEGGAVIESISLHNADGAPLAETHGGAEVELRIACRANRVLETPIIGYVLRNGRGENIAGDNTYLRYRDRPIRVAAGDRFTARIVLQLPWLAVGAHTIAPSVIEGTQRDHIHLHWIEKALVLDVLDSPVDLGAVGVPMLSISCD